MNLARLRFGLLAGAAALALGVAVAFGHITAVVIAFAAIAFAVSLRTRAAGVVILAFVGAYLVLNDRTVLKVPGFGSGIVPVLGCLAILLSFATLVIRPRESRIALRLVVEARGFLWFVGAGVIFPVLGVISGYPVRTLLAVLAPLTMIAFLHLGAFVSQIVEDFWDGLYRMLVVAGIVELLAGLIQGMTNLGASAPFGSALRQWDLAVAERYGRLAVAGRSLGLFVNPNVYALFGGLLFVIALYAQGLRVTDRAALLAPAVGIVLLGASRGVVLGVLAAVAVEQGYRHFARIPPTLDIAKRLAAGAVLVTTVLTAGSVVARGLLDRFLRRLWVGAGILSFGISADSSASGRVNFWRASADMFAERPLGTFGPPELLLGTAVDNDYVRSVLQGGILYVATYLVALATAYRNATRIRNGAVLRGVVVVVAVAGLTQTSITYVPPMVALWFLSGAALREIAEKATEADPAEAAPDGAGLGRVPLDGRAAVEESFRG